VGGRRKLHVEELHNLYASPVLLVWSKRGWDERGMQNAWGTSKMQKILVGKPEGKRPHGRPKRRWEDSMYLREIWWEDVDWMHLAQDRGQWAENFLTSWVTVSFWRRTLLLGVS
jgi:hypothetical protein